MIVVRRRLEVFGEDSIMVPGSEPESSLSSLTLSRWIERKNIMVKVNTALAAIPGSYIEYQINNGRNAGIRRKWFVLPDEQITCPCSSKLDWFQILKDIGTEVQVAADEQCELIDQGFPTKTTDNVLQPVAGNYREEGDFMGMSPQLLNNPYYYFRTYNPSSQYQYDIPMTV